MTTDVRDTLRVAAAVLAIIGAVAFATGHFVSAAAMYAVAYVGLSVSTWEKR